VVQLKTAIAFRMKEFVASSSSVALLQGFKTCKYPTQEQHWFAKRGYLLQDNLPD